MQEVNRKEIYESLGELQQLGLAVSYVSGMGQLGGGGYEHNLTDYGIKFIEFVPPHFS